MLPDVSTSSRLACTSRNSAGPEASVSRQPRLPQRQIGPCGSTTTWPISPGRAAVPAVGATVHDDPRPDPGRDRDVGGEAGVAARAERRPRPARPGWRRCRRRPASRGALELVRHVDLRPARQHVRAVKRAAVVVDRPGERDAHAEQAVALDVGLAPAPARPARRRGRARSWRRGRRRGRPRPRRARCATGRRPRRAPCRGRSRRPTAAAADGSSSSSAAGRPG